MALFVLSIPVMIVMVALAVVPLVVVSRAEHRSMAARPRASADTHRQRANALAAESLWALPDDMSVTA
jgi:hypothetical protein